MIKNILAVLGTLFFANFAAAQIAWQTNLQTAHAQAQAQDKLLLIHFYTEPCVWCDRLEEGSFQSPDVIKTINQRFVPVKIHGGKNPDLAKYFKVRGYPMDVVVDADGNIYGHGISPQQPEKYVGMLLASIDERGPRAYPDAQIAEAPQSAAAADPSVQAHAAPLAQNAQYPVPDYAQSPPQAGLQTPQSPAPAEPMQANHAPQSQFALPPQGQLGPRTGQVAGYQPPPTLSSPAEQPAKPAGGGLAVPPEINVSTPSVPSVNEPQQPSEAASTQTNTIAAAKSETFPLGLDGYCPVTVLRDDRWIPGDKAYGAYHMGRLYLFANEEAQTAFMSEPNRYGPMLAGNDVVALLQRGQVREGSREWGLTYNNRMYLFSSEESLNEFYANPDQYSAQAELIMRQATRAAETERR